MERVGQIVDLCIFVVNGVQHNGGELFESILLPDGRIRQQ